MDEIRETSGQSAKEAAAREAGQPPAHPVDTDFDLYALHPTEVPEMSRREKRAAWALGTSGVAAGLVLATGVSVVVLYVVALAPLVAWWGLLSLLG